MSYGAEGLGAGEAPGIAPGVYENNDERISGAFYIGRSTFRMETLEGGVVSAPLIGALTPEKGIGYLPAYSAEHPDDSDDTFARAGEETPQSDWLLTEPDHQPRQAMATSRSLVSRVAILAFISGALLTGVLFTMKPSPVPVPVPVAASAPTTLIQAPPTVAAPAPPAEAETPPPPGLAVSLPSKVAVAVVVAKSSRKGVAAKERDRERAALARFSKLPPATPPTHWVDPFAD
jgi:hypothetical protein